MCENVILTSYLEFVNNVSSKYSLTYQEEVFCRIGKGSFAVSGKVSLPNQERIFSCIGKESSAVSSSTVLSGSLLCIGLLDCICCLLFAVKSVSLQSYIHILRSQILHSEVQFCASCAYLVLCPDKSFVMAICGVSPVDSQMCKR